MWVGSMEREFSSGELHGMFYDQGFHQEVIERQQLNDEPDRKEQGFEKLT